MKKLIDISREVLIKVCLTVISQTRQCWFVKLVSFYGMNITTMLILSHQCHISKHRIGKRWMGKTSSHKWAPGPHGDKEEENHSKCLLCLHFIVSSSNCIGVGKGINIYEMATVCQIHLKWWSHYIKLWGRSTKIAELRDPECTSSHKHSKIKTIFRTNNN